GSLHLGCVTQTASDALEKNASSLCASARVWIWDWPISETHHDHELQPIRQDVKWIIEGLISGIVRRGANAVIEFWFFRALTSRILLCGGWKKFVGNAQLDVVSLSSKHSDRLVLSLPSETRDGAIVPTSIGMTRDA